MSDDEHLVRKHPMALKFVLCLTLALSLAGCAQSGLAQSPASSQASTPSSTTPAATTPADAQPDAPQATASAPGAGQTPQMQTPGVPASERPPATGGQPAVAGGDTPAAARTEASLAAESAKIVAAQKPTPQFREVTIPAGTRLSIRLARPVASDTSAIEDPVRGTLTSPIIVGGVTAVPADADVVGTVLEAKESGRVKGLASITFRFDRLIVGGERHMIQTARVTRQAKANRKDDVKKGAIGGAAGAIVGGIVGGGKGAAIGAGVGATGAIVATKGDEVGLPAGTTVRTTLQQPLKVVVPLTKGDR